MSIQTRDFGDVAARARELGCQVPVGIALLPGNFATAAHARGFCYHAAVPLMRSAWQNVGLEDEGPGARDTSGENGDCTAAHPMGCSEGLSPFSRPQAERPDHVTSESTKAESRMSDSGLATSSGIRTPIPSPQPPAPFPCDVPLVVFFGASLLGDQPWRVTVALGLVSSVFASQARRTGERAVRLDVVVER
ncbi:hypothetical protein FJY68_03770 [candidate division WOR-3 bacterium]|uniref:Uncharacterized protein n=1 Tax=candidate division WOR-3 bacterium TaxID=2052148 RepID=A0A937XGE9_UNCW3|nr:hypothetical protein [candidate division WOR-3 bacterium]